MESKENQPPLICQCELKHNCLTHPNRRADKTNNVPVGTKSLRKVTRFVTGLRTGPFTVEAASLVAASKTAHGSTWCC